MLISYQTRKIKGSLSKTKSRARKKEIIPMRHFNESPVKITKYQAIEITKKFLEQHHNVSGADAVLKGDEWFVTMCVGMSENNTRQVRIDTNTGKILGCT
ncbi:protein of unknown function [Nitrosotalea devaniterrae]|uniref:PepSY domain-containing protein n=1 Tax=Nitrosotalea devaniterrae TaxID=1078905 RepID=A0A128A4L6_9ARCH|nr:protein of unknown function [Candidatus Nitrosotalea devanaterra]